MNKNELSMAAPAVPFLTEELAALIGRASAVSFDFFDTLFVRPLTNPEDAFDILGRQFGLPNFRNLRRAAQVEAFTRMTAAGRREISLQDIYTCFTEPNLRTTELMQAEYALELSLVEPNPEVFTLFLALQKAGKQVVITSDMYLSTDFFMDALRQHGLTDVPLFISADCNATKRDTGELFDIVATRLSMNCGEILHIGDNQVADVTRARDKGLMSYHYRATREFKVKKDASLSMSIGYGLLATSARDVPRDSYTALGFVYGGAANLGFLEWIKTRAQLDRIDHLLFLSRDGYALERIARTQDSGQLPKFSYFLGSRTAYTLASIYIENFTTFIPFFLSGSDGLAPYEVLERIGVQPPAPSVMADLGLGAELVVGPELHAQLASFLYAYRWEILKVCQSNRRALFQYLREVGITAGSKIALVDVGWNGTTQEAFESAVRSLMPLDVTGYYFCLANTPERVRRQETQVMLAMVNDDNTSSEVVAQIYANRVAVEQFFSAPHGSVIGLHVGKHGTEAVMDAGRGDTLELQRIAEDVCEGAVAFAKHYETLRLRTGIKATPLEMAWSLIELLTEAPGAAYQKLGLIRNFDAWGSSRNHELKLADYLPG